MRIHFAFSLRLTVDLMKRNEKLVNIFYCNSYVSL